MHSRSTYIAASAAIISGVLLGLAISDQRWGWTSATELEQQLDYNNYGHPSMIYLQGGERGIGPYYYTEEEDPKYTNFVVAGKDDTRSGIKTLPTISPEYMRGYVQVCCFSVFGLFIVQLISAQKILSQLSVCNK
jgi:hypothetical protein